MNISVNDLAAVIEIIDVVTARGAIKGDEMLAVGTIRNKLSSFIEEVAEKQNTESTSEEDEGQ